MNLATVTLIVIAACGAMMAGMASLIQRMVLSRLDSISEKLDMVHERIDNHEARIIRLEEWRNSNTVIHRRRTDVCSHADCPFSEEGRSE